MAFVTYYIVIGVLPIHNVMIFAYPAKFREIFSQILLFAEVKR